MLTQIGCGRDSNRQLGCKCSRSVGPPVNHLLTRLFLWDRFKINLIANSPARSAQRARVGIKFRCCELQKYSVLFKANQHMPDGRALSSDLPAVQ